MSSVFTGYVADLADRRIYPGEIICKDGVITEIRELERVPEGSLYYLPGLTDAHVHVESSMMTPANFAKVAVTHGVVSAVSDPHEIVLPHLFRPQTAQERKPHLFP